MSTRTRIPVRETFAKDLRPDDIVMSKSGTARTVELVTTEKHDGKHTVVVEFMDASEVKTTARYPRKRRLFVRDDNTLPGL